PLEGTPKSATIQLSSTNKCYVSFSCECAQPVPLPPTDQQVGIQVGIDVGLKAFAALSTGDTIANPRLFRQEEQALAKAQRTHQVAVDAHKTLLATLTRHVRAELPDLEARDIWRLVSQDRDERTAWQERRQRRKVVARVNERIRWRRSDFTHR